jgi:pyruvate-formate lyase
MSHLPKISDPHLLQAARLPVDRADNEPALLQLAQNFTRCHRESTGKHPAERELLCLKTLFPGILLGPREDDLLAGRIHNPLAYVGNVCYPENDEGDNCGFGYDRHRAKRICEAHYSDDPNAQEAFASMADYWKSAATYRAISDGMDHPMREVLFTRKYVSDSAVCHRLHRVASPSIDYSHLLKLGVTGYQKQIEARTATADSTGIPFLKSACAYLDLFKETLGHYQAAYAQLAERAAGSDREKPLRAIAGALSALQTRAPESFFEAVQLVHLFTVTGFTSNAIGRLDDDLGPYLQRDLDAGRTTREAATRLLVNYWQLLSEHNMNSRMTLGGLGRRDPAAADVFCELALEATRIFYTQIEYRQDRVFGLPLVPQVAFRMSEETPKALRKLALDVIASGATFPILYDDEANVPAVANAFHITPEEAKQYTFFDCGEYLIHGRSIGTPSTIINLPKALEVALHDGIDPRTGKRVGPGNPQGNNFASFDEVWGAYTRQVEHDVAQCARFQKHQFDRLGEDCGFLAMSLLMEDCLKRGRHALGGGCAYLGGTLETYGNITVADSLYAIQKAVFEEQRIRLKELVSHLDQDFCQDESLAEYLLELPKFGNDLDEVDAFAQRVTDHVCAYTRAQAEPAGLHHFLVVVINNSANVSVGHHVNATADGRRSGMPVSNGHTPTPGRDTNGITALVNSILKLSPMEHGGAVHNLRFSKQTIQAHRPMVEAILHAYFGRGGTQCMITITSREELEDALEHPENYGHLLVRVGGYSARFIDLPKDIQMEIINRNAY